MPLDSAQFRGGLEEQYPSQGRRASLRRVSQPGCVRAKHSGAWKTYKTRDDFLSFRLGHSSYTFWLYPWTGLAFTGAPVPMPPGDDY